MPLVLPRADWPSRIAADSLFLSLLSASGDGVHVEIAHLQRRLVGGGECGGLGSDSLADKLRGSLVSKWGRVLDLFRGWDADGSGTISKSEFVAALPAAGIFATGEQLGMLFHEFDRDGDGEISFRELHAMLRQARREADFVPDEEAAVALVDLDALRTELQSKWAAVGAVPVKQKVNPLEVYLGLDVAAAAAPGVGMN